MTARLPDAVKALRGGLQKSRTASARAAKAAALGQPSRGTLWKVPSDLEAASAPDDWRDAWRECAAAVNHNRTATLADRPLFGEMVRALLLARRFGAQLEKDGATYTSESGATKAHPAVNGWSLATKQFAALAGRFGCSPTDRDRALDLGGDKADATARFLFGLNRGVR